MHYGLITYLNGYDFNAGAPSSDWAAFVHRYVSTRVQKAEDRLLWFGHNPDIGMSSVWSKFHSTFDLTEHAHL